ncbi:mu-type opioid receptor-like [Mytilus edulis]|uniref:G-protein coupled receptors family 1 profile domain-containing protein n=1 Tax=Mytilus edulis TaxID=6550 RepID=A0A8S3S516_MYTED|nr:unnamed protein product [Mytilus edulis]
MHVNATEIYQNSTTEYLNYYGTVNLERDIQKYSKPVICLSGFIGNFLSAAIFLSKSQRKTSCSLYLGVRSLSDTGFLISLFFIWLGDMQVNAFKAPGLCQSIIFLSYVCAFLSVWFIVIVTFENYIRICMPFQVNTYCTTRKAKIIIVLFTLISFIIYNFTLWTFTVKIAPSGMSLCLPIQEFNYILQYLYYIDTVVTLVLPTLITIVLMIPITYNLLELLRRQQARLTGKSQQKDRRQSTPQSKVTKLLFSVSLAFILLSLPSHVVRTHLAISSFVALEEIDPLVVSLKYIFETIYYLSFAVNIVIYLTFGDRFRSDFKNKFCSRFSSKKEQSSQTTPSVLNADREESNTLLCQANNVRSETHV